MSECTRATRARRGATAHSDVPARQLFPRSDRTVDLALAVRVAAMDRRQLEAVGAEWGVLIPARASKARLASAAQARERAATTCCRRRTQPAPGAARPCDIARQRWRVGAGTLSLSLSFFLSLCVCARVFRVGNGTFLVHSSDLHRQMHLGLTPVREGCENAFQKRVGNSPCGQELAPGVSPPTRRSPYNACCRCQCLGAVVGPARGGQTRTRICTPRKHRLWLLPTMFSTLQTQNQSITTNS